MRNLNKYILCGVVISIMFSCGTYDEILKGRDYEAKYQAGLSYFKDKKYNRTVALFAQVESIFEGTNKADSIKFLTAKSYYELGKYDESSLLFDDFRKTYARSPFAEESEFLYAMSFYFAAPNSELDQTATEQAILAFTEYASRYPSSPNSETVDDYLIELKTRLFDKAYYVAYTYYNISYYNSAITAFKNLLRKYPDHPKKEEIVYLIAKSNYEFAKSSVATKQRERYYNTIDAGMNFNMQYPESKYSNEINRMISNSQKLSARRQIIDNKEDQSYLTDKEILKNASYADKLDKKVNQGKLTDAEAEKMLSDKIQKSELKAKRRHERDLSDAKAIHSMRVTPTEANDDEQGMMMPPNGKNREKEEQNKEEEEK